MSTGPPHAQRNICVPQHSLVQGMDPMPAARRQNPPRGSITSTGLSWLCHHSSPVQALWLSARAVPSGNMPAVPCHGGSVRAHTYPQWDTRAAGLVWNTPHPAWGLHRDLAAGGKAGMISQCREGCSPSGRVSEMGSHGNRLQHSLTCKRPRRQLWGEDPGATTSPLGGRSCPTPTLPGCLSHSAQTPRGQGLLHFFSFAAQNRKSQNTGLSLG